MNSSKNRQSIALITGITGQDGSYLAELLVSKGYIVHGIARYNSGTLDRFYNLPSYNEIKTKVQIHYACMEDMSRIESIVRSFKPDEIYHLASQSHVGHSFNIPVSTCEITALGTLKMLEIIKNLPSPKPKFLHASSSEIFGQPRTAPQNELTCHNPITPYGIAKSFATNMVKLYRDIEGLFAVNAICYNHESPRRSDEYVTRKIIKTAVQIKRREKPFLELGDIYAQRDWGYAPDYVEAMYMALQHDKPQDYIVATGKTHTVKEWLETTFKLLDLDVDRYVKINAVLNRPNRVTGLVGDIGRITSELNWRPKHDFNSIIIEMIKAELKS